MWCEDFDKTLPLTVLEVGKGEIKLLPIYYSKSGKLCTLPNTLTLSLTCEFLEQGAQFCLSGDDQGERSYQLPLQFLQLLLL